jgi:3-keto-5-aminohexanoate cleavage enzyme
MFDLSQDWATLPGRKPLRDRRAVRAMDMLPDPRVQERWDLPARVVVRAAVSGRAVNEAGSDAPIRNFALDFDSFVEQAAESIAAGAAGVHIDFGGITNIQGAGLSIQQCYEKVIGGIRAATSRDWVPDVNILRGQTFLENILPLTSGLGETAPMAPDNPVDWMEAVAQVMTERGQRLFFAVHSAAEVDLANRLVIRKGILEKPYCWCVLIGYAYDETNDRLATFMPHPKAMIQELTMIVDRIREIDEDCFIEVCSAGRAAQYVATLAILMGLHVRVGTEDTVWRYPHRDELLSGNREMVERTRTIAEQLGRPLATAEEFRQMLRMKVPAVSAASPSS